VWQKRRSQKKVTQSPLSRLAPVSNMRLNFNRAFETIRRLQETGNVAQNAVSLR
jgi:hypothetical protein